MNVKKTKMIQVVRTPESLGKKGNFLVQLAEKM